MFLVWREASSEAFHPILSSSSGFGGLFGLCCGWCLKELLSSRKQRGIQQDQRSAAGEQQTGRLTSSHQSNCSFQLCQQNPCQPSFSKGRTDPYCCTTGPVSHYTGIEKTNSSNSLAIPAVGFFGFTVDGSSSLAAHSDQ